MRSLSGIARRSPLPLIVVCLIPCLVRPAPAVAATKIVQDVVSSAGGQAQSASYAIHDTFGQDPLGPVAVGATLELHDGFWGAVGMGGAVPADTLPPSPVVSFAAMPLDMSIGLEWTNPGDADFDHTLIRYSTTSHPTGPGDGTPVENGADGEFPNSPASVGSFVHTGLTNGITYYYSAFAADEVPNYSVVPAQASAAPSDVWPPLPVSVFTATALADGSVELEWATPDDSDFEGALIRYSTSTYPALPDSGSPVPNGNNGLFPGNPVTVYDFTHTGLPSDVTHYYSIFAYDEVPNYSSAANADATPHDETPPELSISVLQNPYLTNYVDVYIVGSETLIDTSIHCDVAGTDVAMDLVDADENVWKGDYDICCTGLISIHAQARDINLNWAAATHTFSSALILASTGGIALSVDGLCCVSVRGDIVRRDTYVLIFEADADAPSAGKVYEISPAGLDLTGFVEVAIAYPDTVSQPQHLSIARVDAKGTTPVESYLDPEAGRLIAYVDEFGSYGLLLRPDVVTPTYGVGDLMVLQNIPNPFAGSTLIGFEIPGAGEVRVEVISIDGRLVTDLMDGFVIPGRHSIEWDGCDAAGRRVASGVYFYRVRYGSKTITSKMVHLR